MPRPPAPPPPGTQNGAEIRYRPAMPERPVVDRIIFGGAWLALGLALLTPMLIGALILADEYLNDQAIGMLMAGVVFFEILLTLGVHLMLLAAAIIRGVVAGPRAMRWVYLYLLISFAAYGTAFLLIE